MPGPEILKYMLMRRRCDKGHNGQNRRTYVRLGHFGFGSLVRQLRSLAELIPPPVQLQLPVLLRN